MFFFFSYYIFVLFDTIIIFSSIFVLLGYTLVQKNIDLFILLIIIIFIVYSFC